MQKSVEEALRETEREHIHKQLRSLDKPWCAETDWNKLECGIEGARRGQSRECDSCFGALVLWMAMLVVRNP